MTQPKKPARHGVKLKGRGGKSRTVSALAKGKPASAGKPRAITSDSDPSKSSPQEDNLAIKLEAEGMGGFERQFRFHEKRRWLSDFSWPDLMLAVEYDGITGCRKSRHTTIKGYTGDCEKLNEAAILGWTVIRVTAPLMHCGVGMDQIKRAYQMRKEMSG